MKKIRIVSAILQVFKWLLIAGSLFIGTYTLLYENDVLNIGSPPMRLEDKGVESRVNELLDFDTNLRIFITGLDVELPVTPELKAAVLTSLFLVTGYLLWVLQIIIRIVKDIRNRQAFHAANIHRLKQVAWLVVLAPVLMSLLYSTFIVFVNYNYDFPEEVTFKIGGGIDFELVVIGLLLYAIAVAFGEGIKLKEEQDLPCDADSYKP